MQVQLSLFWGLVFRFVPYLIALRRTGAIQGSPAQRVYLSLVTALPEPKELQFSPPSSFSSADIRTRSQHELEKGGR